MRSASKKPFVQCEIRKITPTGEKVIVSWIPEKFSKVGKMIGLKPRVHEDFEEGWVVSKVYGKKMLDELLVVSEQYKHTRDVSDV